MYCTYIGTHIHTFVVVSRVIQKATPFESKRVKGQKKTNKNQKKGDSRRGEICACGEINNTHTHTRPRPDRHDPEFVK